MWILELDCARLLARLGTTAEERAVPQPVDLGIAIHFANRPPACETDELDGAVCYARLVAIAKQVCDGREFHLIESLAQQLLEALRKELPRGAAVEVSVTKLNSPVEELRGGVRFRLRG